MLLSDRDILAEIDNKRVGLDPFEPAMVQPSSIDVRLDRFFRVFENHRYPHIDPAQDQPDLTRMVEPEGDEPFILHPGEFALDTVADTELRSADGGLTEKALHRLGDGALIESVLMGVPLPLVYLSEEPNATYSVIDGQQRMTSLYGPNLFYDDVSRRRLCCCRENDCCVHQETNHHRHPHAPKNLFEC